MQKYDIHEDGSGYFATVEAKDAVDALRKTANAVKRSRDDYCVLPGEKIHVRWRAKREDDDEWQAEGEISVPGTSDRGCDFRKV